MCTYVFGLSLSRPPQHTHTGYCNYSLVNQMCINPQLKIILHKYTIYSYVAKNYIAKLFW